MPEITTRTKKRSNLRSLRDQYSQHRSRQEARDPARFIARTVNARSILPCSLAIRRTRLRGLCPREVEISLSKNHETVIETLISPRLSMFELVSSEIERSNPKPRLDNFFLILRSVAYSTTYKAQPKPIRRCSKPAFNLKFSHPMTTRDLQARHKAPVGIFNSLSLQAQEL